MTRDEELLNEIIHPTRSDYFAILKMLLRRATWRDRWRARKYPGHWVNQAKRELLVEYGWPPLTKPLPDPPPRPPRPSA